MQVQQEQCTILRNKDGEMMGIVYFDMATRHPLIYTVDLADMDTITDLLKCKDLKVKND